MPVSDARKRANTKWNASRDNITIRVEKETGAAIRSAAAAAGLSVTQYILACLNGAAPAPAVQSPGLADPAVTEHIEKTGEAEAEFIARAISDTIGRDNTLLRLGMPIQKKKGPEA